MEAALQWTSAKQQEIADPDVQLMLRFKDGDPGAFESLFARHTRALVNFAYRFVRSREVAEELAQDVFLKVYESAGSYQAQAKFTTWLYRIATNVCLNEIRKPHFRAAQNAVDESLCVAASEPDDSLERQSVGRVLKQALDGIPENQRTAFILNKYQEFSYAEVAGIMKISEKAVKSLIHRAKEALAARLQPLLPELLEK